MKKFFCSLALALPLVLTPLIQIGATEEINSKKGCCRFWQGRKCSKPKPERFLDVPFLSASFQTPVGGISQVIASSPAGTPIYFNETSVYEHKFSITGIPAAGLDTQFTSLIPGTYRLTGSITPVLGSSAPESEVFIGFRINGVIIAPLIPVNALSTFPTTASFTVDTAIFIDKNSTIEFILEGDGSTLQIDTATFVVEFIFTGELSGYPYPSDSPSSNIE